MTARACLSDRRVPLLRRRWRLLAAVVTAILLIPAVDTFPPAAVGAQDGRRSVTVTTGQVADLVRNVGGDRVDVEALMGPGVDPHLYSASESDLGKLFDADLIFYSGLELEGRLGDVLEQLAGQKPVVAVAAELPADRLLASPQYPDQYDPHVWGDPTLWALTVERVYQTLAEADRDGAAAFRANADAYLAQLQALDQEVAARIATIPAEQRVLVTAHDAFAYFGRRYGLEVVGLQGISTDTEAGVADIQRVAEFIAGRGIRAIFVESSVPPGTIEAVRAAVRDRGLEVAIGGQLYSDALGDEGTPAGTYVGMIRANVETITTALGGAPAATPAVASRG